MEYIVAFLAALVAFLLLALWLQHRSARSLQREQERLQQASEDRFRTIASEVIENNSLRLRQLNEERLEDVLKPLRDNLNDFRRAVDEAYQAEARERFSLRESLREMVELNRTIGREARELSEALRGNSKVQGDWGETILETILEKSGLKRDTHFKVQVTTGANGTTLRDDAGTLLRPDVVVYYPDNRCVVIDSKVSLTAYVNHANADNDDDRAMWGRRHVDSVRAHIRELAVKNYQDFVGDRTADFVILFIPNEAAYLAAMNLEPGLWEEAYDRRVLIVSPTHLISVVRIVEQLWRQDDMKRNVIEIATEGGKMYDKFVAFVEDMRRIDRALGSTRTAFDDAMRKLSDGTGNLVGRAERMRELGAKATKRLNGKQ